MWRGASRWFDDVAEAGYLDVQRILDPDGPGPYTWWSYRGRAFDNDAGWRIDALRATPGLANAVRSVVVERAPSYDTRWSDHAPVTAVFDWDPASGRMPLPCVCRSE